MILKQYRQTQTLNMLFTDNLQHTLYKRQTIYIKYKCIYVQTTILFWCLWEHGSVAPAVGRRWKFYFIIHVHTMRFRAKPNE